MTDINPYQSPSAEYPSDQPIPPKWETVRELAIAHRRVNIAALLYLLVIPIGIYLIELDYLIAGQLTMLAAFLFGAVSIYRLTALLVQHAALSYLLTYLIPVYGLFSLLSVSRQVSELLREIGVRVDLMGADLNTIPRAAEIAQSDMEAFRFNTSTSGPIRNVEDLYALAIAHRRCSQAVLFYFMGQLCSLFIASNNPTVAWIVWLATYLVCAVATFRLALIFSTASAVVYVVVLLIPLLGLIGVIRLNQYAADLLREVGVKTGQLGADLTSVAGAVLRR